MAIVFKRLIFTPGGRREITHRLLNVIINRVVPGVGGLTGLEIGVGVCGSAANNRMLRIQRACAVGIDLVLRHQLQNRVVRQRDDFIDFVRSAETIEEMNKRHPAF
ncbi:hypothetical protein D3C81_1776800 [compost metagenome]